MNKPVKIGLLGFGTVGCGIAEVLADNADIISGKAGCRIEIGKIADPDLERQRSVKVDKKLLTANAQDVISDTSISIIAEAIGGVDPALKYILSSIEAGKHVVTSNKEVVAKHLRQINEAARNKGVKVLFEASVGGAIPILAALRRSLAANEITDVYGIVNGTTNFILSKMTGEKREFGDVLKEAQKKGFAESDPKNDIEGYDASYKAAILASLAFGVEVNWQEVKFEGISKISLEDIKYASEIGYVIKLLAIAKKTGDSVDVRVHPALVPAEHPLASVRDQFNAIYVKGNAMGASMFYGEGAGARPTASAMISDMIEICDSGSRAYYPALKKTRIKSLDEASSRYYIRLKAKDMPGVLAAVSGIFAEKKVSIQAALQKETVGSVATVVIIVHTVAERDFKKSMELIAGLPHVIEVCNTIRVGMEQ
ncbi:MAG: homoserine dehydrogenase [Candidatus Margulisiibacteriota bacterium]